MDDAQTSIPVPAVRPPLLDQSPARAKREPWLHIVMGILVAVLLLMVVALPSVNKHASESGVTAEQRVRAALEEIRRSIGQYRYDHGVWPGTHCNDDEDPSSCFVRQLTGASNADGKSAATSAARTYGPYLARGVPVNPCNGLATIRVLREGERWPEPADGTSGWIYRPASGELRANAPGEAGENGLRFSDL